MNRRLTAHLFGRLLRGRRLIGMVALASVAGIVAWVSLLGRSPEEGMVILKDITSTVPAATLSIAVLFLATAVLRDERDGGTFPFLFISPVSRVTFAVSAWVAAAGASLLVAAAGWLVAFLAAGVTIGSWTVALPALSAYVAAALAYSAIFMPLGYLFSRSLLPGLGYVFVWEGILASVVPGLSASSVWRIAMSIYADLTELSRDARDVLGSVKPGLGGGVATVAILVALGIAVLSWAMKARDAV
jgi:ABC-type transport system involved in multi-copper enzyme maturation permease subunit